jgi:hypothetical protein
MIRERAASLPQEQFEAQVEEERERIWYADPRTKSSQYRSIDTTFDEDAREKVKKRWIEQGIWKNKWDDTADGLWKHEEPLQIESELATDTEAVPPPRPFSFAAPQKLPQPNPRRPKSDNGKRRIAQRRAVREHEREASRPYFQFVYQISKERERVQEDESANGEGADAADINMRAYENVKNTWMKRGIWNGRWGILPGMSWKHERPLEEEPADDAAFVPANPLANGSHGVGEAPSRIFGSPSPISSNHRQTSGTMSTSQQGPSMDVDSARLENGGAELSASNLPRLTTDKRTLHTTGQVLWPSRKQPSNKDWQPQPAASAFLGPAHSSRVSKATRNKMPGPQRWSNASQEVSSGAPPVLSGLDITRIPPRRSKRLEMPEPSKVEGTTLITSTDSPKVITQLRQKRKSTGSAKPRGISKKQPSSKTRRKARKDNN